MGLSTVPNRWPEALSHLLAQLRAVDGRFAVVAALEHQSRTLTEIERVVDGSSANVGEFVSAGDAPPDANQLASRIGDAVVLRAIEALFWGELAIDPIRLFRQLARSGPRIVEWPGEIKSNRATYGGNAFPDHYETTLSDVAVLTPKAAAFSDEVPYETRWVPA